MDRMEQEHTTESRENHLQLPGLLPTIANSPQRSSVPVTNTSEKDGKMSSTSCTKIMGCSKDHADASSSAKCSQEDNNDVPRTCQSVSGQVTSSKSTVQELINKRTDNKAANREVYFKERYIEGNIEGRTGKHQFIYNNLILCLACNY